MSYSQMIVPTRELACGRVFHADRRGAEAHRVAMEVWYRAVGRGVAGHRLAVYRCKRCAGYHVAFKRVRPIPAPRVHALAWLDHWKPLAAGSCVAATR